MGKMKTLKLREKTTEGEKVVLKIEYPEGLDINKRFVEYISGDSEIGGVEALLAMQIPGHMKFKSDYNHDWFIIRRKSPSTFTLEELR